jgi:hypothetical protein
MNVSYIGRYVGLVQSTIQNMSQLTIRVNLVFDPSRNNNGVEGILLHMTRLVLFARLMSLMEIDLSMRVVKLFR